MTRPNDIPGICPIGQASCLWTCIYHDPVGMRSGGYPVVSWPACTYDAATDPCPLVQAGVERGPCEECRWARERTPRTPWPERCALAADPTMDERLRAIREVEE